MQIRKLTARSDLTVLYAAHNNMLSSVSLAFLAPVPSFSQMTVKSRLNVHEASNVGGRSITHLKTELVTVRREVTEDE